jgi:hypothetical protein
LANVLQRDQSHQLQQGSQFQWPQTRQSLAPALAVQPPVAHAFRSAATVLAELQGSSQTRYSHQPLSYPPPAAAQASTSPASATVTSQDNPARNARPEPRRPTTLQMSIFADEYAHKDELGSLTPTSRGIATALYNATAPAEQPRFLITLPSPQVAFLQGGYAHKDVIGDLTPRSRNFSKVLYEAEHSRMSAGSGQLRPTLGSRPDERSPISRGARSFGS